MRFFVISFFMLLVVSASAQIRKKKDIPYIDGSDSERQQLDVYYPKDTKKKSLVLERTGEALSIAGSPSATEAAAKLRDALGELAPYAAVSVGAPRKEQSLDPPVFTIVIERVRRGAEARDRAIDPQRTVRLQFGAFDVYRGHDVVYVRREGIDATYVVDRTKANTFFDLL